MANNERLTPLQIAEQDFARKLQQKTEIETYYEDKRIELGLETTDRATRYLSAPGRFFERNIFYAHKGFEQVFAAIANNEPWAIVSGLNPSGPLHFGHKAMFDALLWFQKTFGVEVFIPITNDESYLVGKSDSLAQSRYNAYEYVIPSIIALGFDPGLTKIFVHTDYSDIYTLGIHTSRFTTYNNIRSLFGWAGSESPGMVFYMGAAQMASIIMPQLPEFGGPKTVLVPVGIDQHPYISLSRDVARRMDLVPPAELIWKFLPGLKGPDSKMSASIQDSAIYLTDSAEEAKRKINRAYTGGSPLASVHRERGGIPEVCSVFALLTYNFLSNDEWLTLYNAYKSGELLSGELKKLTTDLVVEFLSSHQQKRETAKNNMEEFILDTPIKSILATELLLDRQSG